jgi:hypothetical protein
MREASRMNKIGNPTARVINHVSEVLSYRIRKAPKIIDQLTVPVLG